jgi:hypothetical protein
MLYLRTLISRLFKPKECFRHFYKIEKFQKECDCVIKCKYPKPPRSNLEYIYISTNKIKQNL